MDDLTISELEDRIANRLKWIKGYREELRVINDLIKHHKEWLASERAELSRRRLAEKAEQP
jgi:hypothetical protein